MIDLEELDRMLNNALSQETKETWKNKMNEFVDQETVKARLCGFIPEGNNPWKTDCNIFEYAAKLGMSTAVNRMCKWFRKNYGHFDGSTDDLVNDMIDYVFKGSFSKNDENDNENSKLIRRDME